MTDWIGDFGEVCAADEAAVLVTVAGVRGSVPREIGAKMIVTAQETIGTIGGGQLEYQCTRIAVGMLDSDSMSLRNFPLGAAMGQCCGGVVEVLFEPVSRGVPDWLRDLEALYSRREPGILVTRISTSTPQKFVVTIDHVFGSEAPAESSALVSRARQLLDVGGKAHREAQTLYEPAMAPDFNIAVFGAGHVGTAVVAALSTLDCKIRWIDSRREIFGQVPRNVRAIEADDPSLEVAAMPGASFYIVMTHSHPLDFDICDRILRRGDARYCGLIGSRSKRRRFEKRYRQQGMPQAELDALVCPIGVDGISGKKPAEIAVAVAAEVLQVQEVATQNVSAYRDNVRPLRP